jgi:LAO/AO transport system kinase
LTPSADNTPSTGASPGSGLADRLLAGDRTALARLITWAENGDERFPAALARIYPHVGRAWRTGITGPPGAGKSTLVNRFAGLLRETAKDEAVGILAIDPSSPFTGGALLGDRIRMEERAGDLGVFIRSMASRGSHGGLSRSAVDACDAMDAFGFAEVLLETVGVGQAEYDVVSAADTVLVVLCPGAGDGIQAMKAGLLEVADVLVVNKADVSGADRLAADLEEAVHVRRARAGAWTPPVVTCSATKDRGVEDVLAAVRSHRAHLEERGLAAVRRGKRVEQVQRLVGERLAEEIWGPSGYSRDVETALESGATPYDVADKVLSAIRAGEGPALGRGGDSRGGPPGSRARSATP